MAGGLYKLNGLDVFNAYGFVVSSGSDSLLKRRTRKKLEYNDWPDENGLEYDLQATPVYDDRTFKLSGAIVASSEADFWSKYNALFNALNVAGTITLESIELATTVKVMYSDMTDINRLTRLKGSVKIAVKIDLELMEVQQA